jgi:hypothetical protein
MGVTQRKAAASPSGSVSGLSVANGKEKKSRPKNVETQPTERWVCLVLISFVILTIVACPQPFVPQGKPSIQHVFFYGWLTAVSTGLGVFPFIFLKDVDTYWVGISNGKYILYLVYGQERK